MSVLSDSVYVLSAKNKIANMKKPLLLQIKKLKAVLQETKQENKRLKSNFLRVEAELKLLQAKEKHRLDRLSTSSGIDEEEERLLLAQIDDYLRD